MRFPSLLCVCFALLTAAGDARADICGTCTAAVSYETCAETATKVCCDVELEYPCPDGYRVTFCAPQTSAIAGAPGLEVMDPDVAGCVTIGGSCGPFEEIVCCPGDPDPCDCDGGVSAPPPDPEALARRDIVVTGCDVVSGPAEGGGWGALVIVLLLVFFARGGGLKRVDRAD
jgi:hypothetical protein